MVVPHAGTWIEIPESIMIQLEKQSSFPTRERGLKFCYKNERAVRFDASFPTRERGLKLSVCVYSNPMEQSFPTRERGLKFPLNQI